MGEHTDEAGVWTDVSVYYADTELLLKNQPMKLALM